MKNNTVLCTLNSTSMASKIRTIESYYEMFIKKGLYILPYAVAIIIIIQLIIQKIKFYFNAQLNQFIGFIVLILNSTMEDEDEVENSLNSEDADRETNVDECSTNSSDTCSQYKVDSSLDSPSNATFSIQDFDDSVSDIEILRGGSDDETNKQKDPTLAEKIEVKRGILRNKRHDLCGRLLAYKLMEFHIDGPLYSANSSPNVPKHASSQIKSKSPLPVADEITFKVPLAPASPQSQQPFIAEYEESYAFTNEEMLARAIQASLDDVAAQVTNDFLLTPPHEDYSVVRLPVQAPTEPITQGIYAPSPSKVVQKQNTPTRAIEGSPHASSPVVNFLDMWNKNYAQDTENKETRQDENENLVVMEDFMEGERYVGDKGKRPISGRYAYKKRAKPSKSESEEPGPSGSGSIAPKKDSAAE